MPLTSEPWTGWLHSDHLWVRGVSHKGPFEADARATALLFECTYTG